MRGKHRARQDVSPCSTKFMGAPKPEKSVEKAALGASLPGAAAHALSRLAFRWLVLPLVVVVPVGGAAALAWRLAHLRHTAEDVEAVQALVERATDEAELNVDDTLRSDTEPDARVTKGSAQRGGSSARDLDSLAQALAALRQAPPPPAPEDLLRAADEARRQSRWDDAANSYQAVLRTDATRSIPELRQAAWRGLKETRRRLRQR
jgi:hypothetical protein